MTSWHSNVLTMGTGFFRLHSTKPVLMSLSSAPGDSSSSGSREGVAGVVRKTLDIGTQTAAVSGLDAHGAANCNSMT